MDKETDICPESNDRRKHCEMVITLNAKFSDFIERYDKDMETTNIFRLKIAKEIEDLANIVRQFSIPYKIMLWLFLGVGGALLIEVAKNLADWLRNHFNP